MEEDGMSLTEVFVVHELLLEHFGGLRGVTEHGFGKLEAAVAAPYQSMFGVDLYPDIASKATALFFGLARSHGFSDGNKRVALVVLLDMLDRHGMRLAADDDEVYVFVMAAADNLSREEVSTWIAARV